MPLDPRNADGTRYDLGSYAGRVQHFFSMASPLNLFISDADVAQSQRLLADFAATSPFRTPEGRYCLPTGTVSDAELWDARRKVDAVIHPDTGW